MRNLTGMFGILKKLIGEQPKFEGEWRLLKYVIKAEVDNRIVLFNILSNEAIVLEKEEFASISSDKNNEIFDALVAKWFLVPINFNDVAMCDGYEKTIDAIRANPQKKYISFFTILPTTDCNARCFYCYELGCQHKNMTQETAHSVVEYICNNKKDGTVQLRWFGGEPLYNADVIDTICAGLSERNVEYESTMTSNGYLFNDEMVRKSQELWNLKSVQITLDGTEKIYNKTKAYIYQTDRSPFEIVIDNMHKLLSKGILIKNRLNMDQHNYQDLFILTEYLLDQFSKYDCYYLYPHALMDNCTAKLKNRSTAQRNFIDQKCKELQAIISERSSKRIRPTYIKHEMYRCMADNDNAIMILPDGSLGKCEHFLDDHHIGNIATDRVDLNELMWYKTFKTPTEHCTFCEFRPACRALSVCPGTRKKCDKEIKQSTKAGIEKYIEDLYFQDKRNTSKKSNEAI